MREYSKEEVALFYEKCIKQDMKHDADFASAVMLCIGGSFGGGKKVQKILDKMSE